MHTTYREFGMMHMMSRPGQWPLADSLWQLLYRPVTAILWRLEGHNQGPVGLDYRYTSSSGAQRSGYSPFTVTHGCSLGIPRSITVQYFLPFVNYTEGQVPEIRVSLQ